MAPNHQNDSTNTASLNPMGGCGKSGSQDGGGAGRASRLQKVISQAIFEFGRYKAVNLYNTELAKWGCEASADDELRKLADTVVAQSQVTLFESQLARSLRKPKELVPEACDKYIKLYAGVPPTAVHSVLYSAAMKEAQKFST